MNRFFNSENWLWKPFSWIADIFILSRLWFLCSVPLVTLGASTTALYDAVAHCLRGPDKNTYTRFFQTFRREFKLSTLSALFWGVLLALGYLAVRFFAGIAAPSKTATMLTAGALLLLTVLLGVLCLGLALLSRFTFSLKDLLATTGKLAMAQLPRTMILGILTAFAAYLSFQFWVPFLFLPALLILLWTVLLEPVFAKYQ